MWFNWAQVSVILQFPGFCSLINHNQAFGQAQHPSFQGIRCRTVRCCIQTPWRGLHTTTSKQDLMTALETGSPCSKTLGWECEQTQDKWSQVTVRPVLSLSHIHSGPHLPGSSVGNRDWPHYPGVSEELWVAFRPDLSKIWNVSPCNDPS